jgi:hypothetical protein
MPEEIDNGPMSSAAKAAGHPLLAMLRGGDRRSIGRSNEVVAAVLREPALFGVLVEGMLHPEVLVRMRAADAAEKVSAQRPDLLRAHKRRLLERVARSDEQEVRWHLAQMIPRLPLTAKERAGAVALLRSYLDDRSSIVKTFAMDALAQLSASDASLRQEVLGLLRRLVVTGTPAMRSRGRRLLAALEG